MTRVIYKYPIKLEDEQVVSVPAGATWLSVHVQDGQICLWAAVNPEAKKEQVPVSIRGTGRPVGNLFSRDYLGTVQQGQFVWHVFVYGHGSRVI